MKPISLQLYSLRNEVNGDFASVLKRVADIGFAGVEPAGFHNLSARAFKSILDDLGLTVSSTHSPWINGTSVQEAVDIAGTLDIDLVACGYRSSDFETLDAIRKTADQVNEFMENLKGTGLKLFIHNHYWEFERLGGRIKHDILAELCPGLLFEIDTYWAANFGEENPAEQVSAFKKRAPLLHIKDGPLVKGEPMLALGTGKMDIPAVINAADPEILRWLVIELDACATDMFIAIEESFKFLVDQGLGHGR